MSENFTYEKIEKYLLRQMNQSEVAAFESQIKSNAQLAQQVEQQKLEHKMIESLIEKDLRKDLNQWKDEAEEPLTSQSAPKAKEVSIFRNRYALAIAVTLALLIAAFLWMNRTEMPEAPIVNEEDKKEIPEENINPPREEIIKESPKNKEIAEEQPPKETPPEKEDKPRIKEQAKPNNYIALADTYYEAIDFSGVNVRGEASDLTNAINAIKENNYSSGIATLSKLIATDDDDLTAHYYLALAYHNQKKFVAAIPHFEKVVKANTDFLYIDDAQWLLALAYLHGDKNPLAQSLLQAIIEDVDHPHFAAATTLSEAVK